MQIGPIGTAAAVFLAVIPAHACNYATAGQKYDELIKIESSKPNHGEFWLVFPGEVEGHLFATVRMDVSNSSDPDQQISILLETEKRDGELAARFWSFGAAGLNVNVFVSWQGDHNPCPIIGQKTINLAD